MANTPINKEIVEQNVQALDVPDLGKASIREIVQLVSNIEAKTGDRYVRMEMGIPGLPPARIGVEAEIEALKNNVASIYPRIDGIQPLKDEVSRFVKLFMNIDVDPLGCIPTVGSMQGGYAAFLVAGSCRKERDTMLFIDPGFPVQKQQMLVMGQKYESFDVYDYRGEKLREKLESFLSKGHIHSIIYSNPNNPTWICLTETELQIIGELANKYDITVMEDLAYFAMDFRTDLSKPGVPPYQPTVARYTDNYVLLISSSKVFSYAGQRIGMMVISDALYHRKYPNLPARLNVQTFGGAIVHRALYSLSSGTSHSAQYALAAMLKAANDGKFDFVKDVKEYGERAHIMKEMFLKNGFRIVYDKDMDEEIGDGFYFTIDYPGMTGGELLHNLLFYGVSAITLGNTGSTKEGLRACVSHVGRNQFADLEKRLEQFHHDFPIGEKREKSREMI
ncbi:aminotransferase class I/II-fold pyridoxal phosphate-dependent enzyme [Prolixibacter denitrificans]|uniref:Aminotransferase n=1 Tax=Prolixibacter denitrificans TaxID=1541063 RepID=A0A2P8C5P2_9BACT|nr:pyridoxal phosphate-dependent aminotransferase [Prolixibacter denitrificans]PSK80267.1 aspartate/methionine/tyrosine aminotransferase [Prolixibacter denitrificans]GET23578.1 aminotransferase [Prolixibacter denitrificans]